MTGSERGPIVCPGCGTRYRWRDAFAGRELKCRCGESFFVPAEGGPGGATSAAPAPVAAGPLKTAIPPAKSSVLEALERREDEAKPSRLRELYVPMIMLPVGFAVATAGWLKFFGSFGAGLVAVAIVLALQVLVFWPAKFGAMVVVANWFQLALGRLPGVLFKTAAVTLGSGAIADVAFTVFMVNTDFDWWALAGGYAIYVVLCGAALAYLFELGVAEVALTVLLVFVPRVMLIYTAALAWQEAFP